MAAGGQRELPQDSLSGKSRGFFDLEERNSSPNDDDANDDDELKKLIGFETASASTLSAILLAPPLPSAPPPLRGDEEAARRHRMAQAVHANWTQRGAEPAGLAERCVVFYLNAFFSRRLAFSFLFSFFLLTSTFFL